MPKCRPTTLYQQHKIWNFFDKKNDSEYNDLDMPGARMHGRWKWDITTNKNVETERHVLNVRITSKDPHKQKKDEKSN